ncbi:hypothetical protein SAMN04488519_107184 [Algoriphagus ornithinivorans]|uniref:Uncharacterized protein n=1 Tax=Algoriphagus ornithinivorans TaxID=226506 RepID=A0A1I5HPI0_9BACT|nr:hypothetical protein SAMN04488519_107184 [Algoriphagus ornithinivorans]
MDYVIGFLLLNQGKMFLFKSMNYLMILIWKPTQYTTYFTS